MRVALLPVLCLSVVLAVGQAGAQEPLVRVSLDEALQLALRQNPTLRAQQFALESTKAGQITAALRPNPTMNVLAEQFKPGQAQQAGQYTVNVGQTIELAGKRQRRIDSAGAATRVAGYQLEDVRRQTILQVKSAFAGVLIAQEQLALAEQNLKTLDDTERLQRLRVEKGDLAELELLRIQVQRFTFERDAADGRQALAGAKIALRTAAGAANIAPDFDVVGELGFKEVPLDRTVLMRKALDNRPDLRAAEADRERARADHRLARANAWGDITPQVEYQRIGPDNTIGFGFNLPIRIFDRNQGEIARTQAEVARVDAVREATALQVLAALDTDLTAAGTQRARVVMLRDTYLPKATQARDTVDYAYRRGGASLLDFLDAQRSYRETALAHLQALAGYLSAIYQLEADAAKSTAETPLAAAPQAPVTVVSPEYKTRVTTLETTGKVQFNEEQLARITAPVTGRVAEVLARPGEGAEPGRRLLVIDSSDLGAAKSDYAKAVSDAERAEHAIDLARDLFEAKAIAHKEVRAAENDYRKAVAERERAASRLGTLGVAETQLKAIASHADASTLVVVRAPRNGTIVERNISPGQVVSYGQSDTPLNLFVIADLNTMWVLADLYEPDVPRVHLGQGVSVTLPCCPGDRYRGTVVNIGDAIDKDSRTLKVRAVVPNPRRTLKAEMFVRVAIETGASRVLTLPQSAVQRRDGKTFVLVETSPGEYQRRPITPGAEFDGLVEVREGVTPADRVVAAGGILLRQGGP